MTDITTIPTTAPTDPALRAIGDRVAKMFHLAAEKAVAHQADPAHFPLPAGTGAEQLLLTRFLALPPARQKEAITKVLASVQAPAAQRSQRFGDLAAVDSKLATPVLQQAQGLALPATLKFPPTHLDALAQHLVLPLALQPKGTAGASRGPVPPGALNKLQIRVKRVTCVDATTFETGDDEIALGGLCIDPTGEVTKVGEFMVGENFHDGVEQVYTPPRPFAGFELTKGGGGQARFASIWEKSAGPVQVAQHGMTRAVYQQRFTELTKQGHRLVSVTGYGVDGQDLYAAGLAKVRGAGLGGAHHALTRAQYQQTYNDLAKQGFHLVRVVGYGVGGQDLYAGIWEQGPGPSLVARHALTRAEYQQTFTDLAKQGFRLKQVSGYAIDTVGGGSHDLYAAIWEKRSGPAWEARHALTAAQFIEVFNDLAGRGYRLIDVSACTVGQQPLYAGIWEQSAGPAWAARIGQSATEYQKTYNELTAQGFRLREVCGSTAWPGFPKYFAATLVLAQKNDGGFYDFLVQLWEMVKERVVGLITAALGAAIGALIGTDTIPGLGTVVGAVVGWVVGSIFDLLKAIFGDWVFDPFTVSVNVPSLNARWPGGADTSSDGLIQYEGFGGVYRLVFDWHLLA